jgi:hypothetical protein
VTRTLARGALLGLALAVAVADASAAQGYRLSLDSRIQRVAFRGLQTDSIRADSVMPGAPSGGPTTPGGIGVNCPVGLQYCYYFAPGTTQQTAPATMTADLTMWGFGVRGLSLHADVRGNANAGDDIWPGMHPTIQLWEGYLDYSMGWFGLRAGRQIIRSRLGYAGFDGGQLRLRSGRSGLEAIGYGGLGLARASALPISSGNLNPLDEFQPPERNEIWGAVGSWNTGPGELRVEWQREIDRSTRYFQSERMALSGALRPVRHLNLAGGAEYNLAEGIWGSADLAAQYNDRLITASAGVRRYRPFFPLWSVWPAFSPVANNSVFGTAAVTVVRGFQVRGRAEHYKYDDPATETPLVTIRNDGNRYAVGGTITRLPRWTFDAGYAYTAGVGGAMGGWDASVGYQPAGQLTLRLYGATNIRPLEYRYEDSFTRWLGFDAEWRILENLNFGASAIQLYEDRRRPDASGFSWDQTMLSAHVTLLLSSRSADRLRLEKALKRMPSIQGVPK